MIQEKFNNIEDIEDMFGLSIVETTLGNNGYPKELKRVLSDFDNMQQCLLIRDLLVEQGHIVDELLIYRKAGCQLWNRYSTSISKNIFKQAKDGDWYIDISIKDNASDIAFKMSYQDVIFDNYLEMSEAFYTVQDLIESLEDVLSGVEDDGCSEVRVFYDPNQKYRIDYCITDESVGYSYDSKQYKVALGVKFNNQEHEN